MEYVIAICGFAGGWLLVAGPVWQAAIELREEEFDQDAFEAAKSSTPQAERVSPWWWLIPPVAYIKRSRRQRAARQAIQDALAPEQLKQAINFLNKANGWVVVALGAYLLAVKETWDLIGVLDWPVWIFWVLIVVMPLVAIGNAVLRTLMTHRALDPDAAQTRHS